MERAEATTALIGGSPSGVWGSGVVVDRAAGVIITNAHVVNSFARDRDLHAWVRGAGGAGGWERLRVEVVHKVAAGTFPDIAVLRWAPAGTAAAVTNPSSGSAGISSSKRADTADAAGQPPALGEQVSVALEHAVADGTPVIVMGFPLFEPADPPQASTEASGPVYKIKTRTVVCVCVGGGGGTR